MTVQELKGKVGFYREALKTKSGKITAFSETGPVGMGVIDAIVSVLEEHERRIDDLAKGLVNE